MEGVCLALAGASFALIANAVSPRGLRISRDYFHLADSPRAVATPAKPAPSGANHDSPDQLLAASLKAVGLGLIGGDEALRLFHDPRREQDLVLFIDAREEDLYAAGHIPGAFEFNHFHPEKYITAVVPACQIAQQIVVYCNGGSCDESKFAALTLRDYLPDISKTNLLIYGGGMTEWSTNGLPIELGERNSGRLLDPRPVVSHQP